MASARWEGVAAGVCAHAVESGVDKGAAVQVGGESQAEQHRGYTTDTITMGTVCPWYAISAHRTCTHQHHKGLTAVLPVPVPIPTCPLARTVVERHAGLT